MPVFSVKPQSNEGGVQIHCYLIRMILNSNDDGTGNTFDIQIRYITYKELPLYDNETLTEEIANSIIDNYYQLIYNEDINEVVGAFRDNEFSNNCITIDTIDDQADAYIVDNSVITIEQLF